MVRCWMCWLSISNVGVEVCWELVEKISQHSRSEWTKSALVSPTVTRTYVPDSNLMRAGGVIRKARVDIDFPSLLEGYSHSLVSHSSYSL